MVMKVTTKLDPSKASGPDCMSVLIVKICETKLLHNSGSFQYVFDANVVFQIVGKSLL